MTCIKSCICSLAYLGGFYFPLSDLISNVAGEMED